MRQLWGACAVALVACGGGGDRQTPSAGRGTASCRLWQDSICDWVERCEVSTREACDSQFQGVTCKSDEAASKCADAIDDAACITVPDRCGPDTIGDPGPAERACETIPSRFCDRAVECGITTSKQACLEVERFDCSRAFAVTLDYETCLKQIDRIDCSIFVQPELCKRVIVSRAEQ
jgi:hypothetical protein